MTSKRLTTIDGGGLDIEEPDWKLLIPNEGMVGRNVIWREAAHRYWLSITNAMRAAGTLGPENKHQLQRLVIGYVRYDNAAAEMFRLGIVLGSPERGQFMNVWQHEMRHADADATRGESELGIAPKRRRGATKVRQAGSARPSDQYLKPVP